LKEGEYVVTKRINISKNITIQSSSDKKPVVKLKIDRANGSIFEIGGNARLKMKGIAINGDSKAEFPAKYAFITSKEGATGYFFMLDNCEIYDFNVEAGAIYKAYKGSLADSIIIQILYSETRIVDSAWAKKKKMSVNTVPKCGFEIAFSLISVSMLLIITVVETMNQLWEVR